MAERAITWATVLDSLERDLELGPDGGPDGGLDGGLDGALDPGAEAPALADTTVVAYADWAPPAELGPIPEHLRARARQVRERQLQALATLTPRVAAARYAAESGRRAASRPAARLVASVYLDVTA